MKQFLRKTAALVALGTAFSFGARGQTYCTPVNNGDCTQQSIAHFEIVGTSLVNPSYCTEGGKYVNYPPTGPTTALLTPGQTYTINVGSAGNGNAAQIAMWIDYNQNGTFETSEFTMLGANVASPGGTTAGPLTPVTYTLPSTAAPGTTRIRVRSNWESSPPITASDACTIFDYGETEDYTVSIGTLTPCSGTPSAGIASGVTSTCAGTPFNLSATPIGLSGVTYLFQKSTDGGTVWTDLGTASAASFYTISSQTVTTQYRVKVTCTSSGGTTTSSPLTVTQNPVTACFCTPVYTIGCSSSDRITNFVLASISNNTGTFCSSSPLGYSDYTSMTTDLVVGVTYTATISIANGGGAGVAIWIDYNENGVFEPSEKSSTTGTIPSGGTGTVTISVPMTATPGAHRMRVRHVYATDGSIIDPCSTYTYGETEDYMVTIVNDPCVGMPVAGITASVTTTCSDVPFTLSGTPTGMTGYTYLFQVSTDGGTTWTNLAPASPISNFTVASQTQASLYRVTVACAGGGTNTSGTVAVAQSAYIGCYCTPPPTYTWDNYITNVNFAGISNPSGAATDGYADYTGSVPAVNVTTGVSYPITVQLDNMYGASLAAWIDFDHSGTFDSDEFFNLAPGASTLTTVTGIITIDPSALAGPTRMRLRTQYNTDLYPSDACNDLPGGFNEGETEDYALNIVIATPCTGTPAATISAAVTTICTGTPFLLTAGPTGFSGLSFQFQVSTDGGTTWTNLGTASPYSFYNVASQSTASQYRVIVTCSGGGTNTSTPVAVAQSAPTSCYCIPPTTYTWDNYITNVNFAGISNPSGAATDGYADYTGTVPAANVTTGMTYPITVNLDNFWGASLAAWIDFDQSGTFDSDEFFNLAPGTSTLTTVTGMITIDVAALAGPTRMRLRTQYNNDLYPSDACNDLPGGFNEGETEDYMLNITIAAPCTGIPAATLTASDTAICSGTPFMLNAGPSGFSGLSFQYQVSTDGGTVWTNLGAATPYTFYNVPTLTTTSQYRVIVGCTGGGSDTSSTVTVVQNPPTGCYCTPMYSTGCSSDDLIDNFILTGEAGSSITHLGTYCSPGAYGVFTDSVVMVLAGSTYTGSISTLYFSDEYFTIWADFNQNGMFDFSEQLATYGPFGNSSPATFTITVPAGTPNGLYRMRVRLVYSEPFIDPCAMYTYGETHDYTLQVGPPCTLGVELGSDTTICAGTPLTLDAGTPGAIYTWSTGDNTQTISVVSAGTYTVQVNDGGCIATDTIVVNAIPLPDAGTINTTGSGASWTFSSSGYSGTSYSWNFGDGTTGTGVTTVHTYAANGNYTVQFIATNACGISDTSTHTVAVTGLGVAGANNRPMTLQVYPNPSNGLTVVEAKGATISSIEVIDNLGRVLLRNQPNAAKTVIDVNGMAQGIYTLRIQTDKGSNTVKLAVGN